MQDNLFIRIDDRKYVNKIDDFNSKINKFLSRISVEKVENGIIILIPKDYNKNKLNIKLITKQIEKIVKTEQIEEVIFEEELKNFVNLKTAVNVLEGKFLMKYVISDILEYIYEIKHENKALQDIHILVNEYNYENLYVIDKLVNEFKVVNIVTSSIAKFRNLEKIYEKNNILITVSNNKRKSIKNAKVIINMDFSRDILKNYIINNHAIIINLNKEKQIIEGNFNGIIINDYNIFLKEDEQVFINEFYGNINFKLYIESFILHMNPKMIGEYVESKSIKIDNLIGIRGIISNEEIVQNNRFNCKN